MIISRLTNDVEALDQLVTDGVTTPRPEHAVAGRHDRHPLPPRLAARARDPDRAAADRGRDVGVPRRARRRAYRAVRERLGLVTATLAEDIAGHARRPVVQPRGRTRRAQLPRGEPSATATANHRTVVLNGLYFPFVDFLSSIATAIVLGFGGYLVFGRQRHARHAVRVHRSTCRTSSTRCSSCRSSTTRSSPRRPRSTRSWT